MALKYQDYHTSKTQGNLIKHFTQIVNDHQNLRH